ncbi:putative GPI-anchored protein pfl2 isoform X2 [Lingula anatina]|uniref:GPI-anchored protein pfl2 isoform X2 n=1 Tax=Lingula anatina TaxID=7574 RepID=A0A1S3K2V7_LINAN|nr:putative GPI-anchored protein pfl2 isoform X2 [Lingula anatina]|eukprot:XP_013416968.1 putative GPI-anchored protein pfl2 isoform X2 [Lingula anatina]
MKIGWANMEFLRLLVVVLVFATVPAYGGDITDVPACGAYDPVIHRDCGRIGTTQDECEHMGCCWVPCRDCDGTVPWCYGLKPGAVTNSAVTATAVAVQTTGPMRLPTETPEVPPVSTESPEQTTVVVATTEVKTPSVMVDTTGVQQQTTKLEPGTTQAALATTETEAETVASTVSEIVMQTESQTTVESVTSSGLGSTTETVQETTVVAVETTVAAEEQTTLQTETTEAPLVVMVDGTTAPPTVDSTQAVDVTRNADVTTETAESTGNFINSTASAHTTESLTTEGAAVTTAEPVTTNNNISVVAVTTAASETTQLETTNSPLTTPLTFDSVDSNTTATVSITTTQSIQDNVTVSTVSTNEATTQEVKMPSVLPTEQATTEITTEETTQSVTTIAGPVDPCDPNGHKLIVDLTRHVNNQERTQYLSDKGQLDSTSWYKFEIQGKPAEIPTECINSGYCSTLFPLRVNLAGTPPPDAGEEINATYCTISVLKEAGYVDCCTARKNLKMTKCGRGLGSFFLYMFVEEVDMENAAFCTMNPGETLSVAQKGVAGPITTPAPETTTVEETTEATQTTEAVTTSSEQTTLAATTGAPPTAEAKDLTEEQEDGVITTVFAYDGDKDEDKLQDFAKQFRLALLAILNDYFKDQSRSRRKRADGDKLDLDDIVIVNPTPRVNKNGELEVAVYIRNSNGTGETILPRGKLLDLLSQLENKRRLEKEVNLNVTDVYAGLPNDLYPTTAPKPAAASGRLTPLEAHMGLFIAMAVLACVCIVVIIVGIIWLKCRRCCRCRCCQKRDKSYLKDDGDLEAGTKKPLQEVHENPIPDEEITRDEAPMLEKANPAVTPNGNGNVIADDDEKNNGWVVPISELSPEELDNRR